MKVQLTEAATQALLSTDTNRQGATPRGRVTEDTLKELRLVGLLGRGGGLTRRGTIVRQRLLDARLDAAF